LNQTDAYPYLSYDIINYNNTDYIVGTVYGSLLAKNFGLNIQVASSDISTATSRVVKRAGVNNCYFYSTIVDPISVADAYNVYFVGYFYGSTINKDKGLVVSRATVQFGDEITIKWKEQDIYPIDTRCYDVFNEIFNPQLYLNKESGDQILYVVIPGRCNSVYKLKLSDPSLQFNPSLVGTYNPATDPDMQTVNILASVYSPVSNTIYFTGKKYNLDFSTLFVLNTNTMKKTRQYNLQANESTPILALDASKDNIFIATAGFDRIYKFSTDFKVLGIAVLPSILKPVSSMYYMNGLVYMVTNEPNAKIGRISELNFCESYCSDFGYCDGSTLKCACVPDYERDKVKTEFVCAPSHYVQNQDTVRNEQGTAAAFGVLFVIALIGGVVGWFLWFRGQSNKSI